ncbi:MAG: acyltransferase [Lautropia sp.]|nr:acyltransferase [Lautropia sp.]
MQSTSSSTVAPPFFANIQGLRAIAAILVLLHHLFYNEQKYFGSHSVPAPLAWMGAGGVDLFFVISGFVMVAISGDQFASPRQAIGFLKRRALRIYPIYWFYTLIVVGIWIVAPHMVNASSTSHGQPNWFGTFTLWPGKTVPLLVQGWTLTFELYFYLIFAAMIAFVPRRWLQASLLLWTFATIGLACWAVATGTNTAGIRLISSTLVLEFIAGCFCALWWQRTPQRAIPLVLGATVAGITTLLLLLSMHGFEPIIQKRALCFGIPAVLIVWSAVLLEKRLNFAAPKLLQSLGDASYSLYLCHTLVLAAVLRTWLILFPQIGLPWASLTAFIAALLAGQLGYRFIETPLNRAVRRVAGWRFVDGSHLTKARTS